MISLPPFAFLPFPGMANPERGQINDVRHGTDIINFKGINYPFH